MSNFCPDTGVRRWSLVYVLWFSHAAGREGRCRLCVGSTQSDPATLGLPRSWCLCFPRLHCSGFRLLHMERALRCVRFQFSGTTQKCRLGWACVLCLPRPSSSGRQKFDRHTPQCSEPFPLRGPTLSFRACQSGVSALSLFLGAGL